MRPSLFLRNTPRWNYTGHESQIHRLKPLRILFCGSDDFSIHSLKALKKLQDRHENKLIQSIDVVHKAPKRTGRGLKVLKEVPIKFAAQKLGLQTHEIPTFTDWQPPPNMDLVVAVSFGLFVPARILATTTYGGINLHPSFLPDLRGPAPIKRAMLLRRPRFGISIQTLDVTSFDHGTVLWQAEGGVPRKGHDLTADEITQHLGQVGANHLSDFISNRLFEQPHVDRSWYCKLQGHRPVDPAPKTAKEDCQIDWAKWDAEEIMLRHRALDALWSPAIHPDGKRTILFELSGPYETVDVHGDENIAPGSLARFSGHPNDLFLATCDKPVKWIKIDDFIIEGSSPKKLDLALRTKIMKLNSSIRLIEDNGS